MGLNFEGSVDNINERQFAFIRDVLQKRGFNNTRVTIDPVGSAGDNYMANVKRITVSDDKGTFKMIAKIAPQNPSQRAMTDARNVFKNEHYMYMEIFPKFQELETKSEVSNDYRLRFAECYGSCIEELDEVILLEDLQFSNFVMLDRFKPMSNECVKSVLKNFAILHSLSYVLKTKEPETFEAMKDKLVNLWARAEGTTEMTAYFDQIEKYTEIIIEGEERKRVFKGAIAQSLLLAAKTEKSDTVSKHSVIQQGDAWTNNILFKFDGEKLQESVMIDYQRSWENSPVYDLQFMIFNCTDHKMRLEHFHDWLDYYHSELDKCLSNFGLKANYIYPRDQLDADMRRHGKLMFGLSILLASMSTMKSEDAGRFKEAIGTEVNLDDLSQAIQFTDFDRNHLIMYKLKIEGLIDSYLEFGLLNN